MSDMMNTKYNATVHASNGSTFVCHALQIGEHLMMTRSNAAQCTGFEDDLSVLKDTPENRALYDGQLECASYDVYMRLSNPGVQYDIVLDNCEGYRNKLAGMMLPPSYQ